jgi:chromosome segregation ATPase
MGGKLIEVEKYNQVLWEKAQLTAEFKDAIGELEAHCRQLVAEKNSAERKIDHLLQEIEELKGREEKARKERIKFLKEANMESWVHIKEWANKFEAFVEEVSSTVPVKELQLEEALFSCEQEILAGVVAMLDELPRRVTACLEEVEKKQVELEGLMTTEQKVKELL